MVELSLHHLKVNGSSLATAASSRREHYDAYSSGLKFSKHAKMSVYISMNGKEIWITFKGRKYFS